MATKVSDSMLKEGVAIPPGAVMSFAMSAAPVGWLACDGTAVSRDQYSSLFTAVGTTYGVGNNSTTFNVPNLQGQFVRGLTTNQSTASRDPLSASRVLGNVQNDAFQGHWHNLYYSAGVRGTASPFNNVDLISVIPGDGYNDNRVKEAIADGTNGTPRITSETRPINIALLYCIKY